MDKISIVTGGGSGIGRAICHILAENGHHVLTVGRRIKKLLETKEEFPGKINILQADVSSEVGRLKIVENIHDSKIEFLIHNAGIIGEITGIENISLAEWQRVMATNVEAPLFLTQKLLPVLTGGRIMNISSGAAHFAIKGWGAYCTSKSALFMIYNMLNTELQDQNIKISSLRPGIVDTEMQGDIRRADLTKMPHLKKFHDLYKDNEMESSERVACFAYWILTKTTDIDFSAKEWDIKDEDHAHYWDKNNK